MKYKVGDKVKVRQDLVDGEEYGDYPWGSNMNRKHVTINGVCDTFYTTEDSCFVYTDEMLDGLVEDTTATSDPTNAELIAAAELLKANCKNQKDCHKCIFMSNVCCKFEYKTPEEWQLPHRKTRKEVFFEKFPNAQTTCERRPLICARHILGDKVECINNCEACWNAPAESEEE